MTHFTTELRARIEASGTTMSRFRYRSLTSLLAILLSSLVCNFTAAEDKMPWAQNLATAQQLAASSQRLLMVHFTSDDCPPCVRLKKKVYSQATFVHNLTTDFVPVQINVTTAPQVAAQFNVKSWPTDIVLTPSGQELMRMTSPQDPTQYVSTMRQLAWRYKSMARDGTQIAQMNQFPMKSPSSTMPLEQQELGSNSASAYPEHTSRPPPVDRSPFASLKGPNALGSPFGKAPKPAPANSDTMAVAVQMQAAANSPSPLVPTENGVTQAAYTAAARAQTEAFNQIAVHTSDVKGVVAQASNQSSPVKVESQVIMNEFASGSTTPSAPPQPQPPRDQPQLTIQPAPQAGPAGNLMTNQFHQPVNNTPPALVAPAPASPPSAMADSEFIPSSSPSQTSFQATTAPIKPSLAMEGYCAVTLADSNEWIKGDRRWGAKHRGRVFLFHSLAAQQKFLADPEKYSPILVGYDPVALTKTGNYLEGKREHGIRYKDQIVMFHSEVALEEFSESPRDYMQAVYQVMQQQPQTMMR
jgi:thiol-disulfide isomerase/thioredoxin/YHS domain-containing protein